MRRPSWRRALGQEEISDLLGGEGPVVAACRSGSLCERRSEHGVPLGQHLVVSSRPDPKGPRFEQLDPGLLHVGRDARGARRSGASGSIDPRNCRARLPRTSRSRLGRGEETGRLAPRPASRCRRGPLRPLSPRLLLRTVPPNRGWRGPARRIRWSRSTTWRYRGSEVICHACR